MKVCFNHTNSNQRPRDMSDFLPFSSDGVQFLSRNSMTLLGSSISYLHVSLVVAGAFYRFSVETLFIL